MGAEFGDAGLGSPVTGRGDLSVEVLCEGSNLVQVRLVVRRFFGDPAGKALHSLVL